MDEEEKKEKMEIYKLKNEIESILAEIPSIDGACRVHKKIEQLKKYNIPKSEFNFTFFNGWTPYL